MLVILADRQVSDSLAKCLGAKLVSMAFPYSAVGSSIAAVDYLVVRQEEMLHDERKWCDSNHTPETHSKLRLTLLIRHAVEALSFLSWPQAPDGPLMSLLLSMLTYS